MTLLEAEEVLKKIEIDLFKNPLLQMVLIEENRKQGGYEIVAYYANSQLNLKSNFLNKKRSLEILKKVIKSDSNNFRYDVKIKNKRTGEFYSQSYINPLNPLRSGGSIGTINNNFAGTIGPFLRLTRNGISQNYLISCWHVLWGRNGFVNNKIVHPSSIDNNPNVIGSVVWRYLNNNIDVAIATINNDVNISNTTVNGVPIGGFGIANNDMAILICGRTSEIKNGIVVNSNYNSVRLKSTEYPDGEVVFKDVIITNRISNPGDSGAVLLNRGNNQLLGVLIGANESYSVFSKINNIVNALKGIKSTSTKSVDSVFGYEFDDVSIDRSDFLFDNIEIMEL